MGWQDCAKLPEVYRDSLEERVCDLLRRLLQRNPAQRASATEAASHPYFSGGAAVAALREQGQVVEVELKHALLEERRTALRASEQHLSLSLTVNRASLGESLLISLSSVPTPLRSSSDYLPKLSQTCLEFSI